MCEKWKCEGGEEKMKEKRKEKGNPYGMLKPYEDPCFPAPPFPKMLLSKPSSERLHPEQLILPGRQRAGTNPYV